MLDPIKVAVVLLGYLILFFSVHGYMDVRMLRSRRSRNLKIVKNEFVIPLQAKILAFLPSIIFWITFFASPFLLYFRVYEDMVAPVLLRWTHENALQVAGLFLLLVSVLLADWGRVSRGVVAPSGPMPEGYKITVHGAYGIVRHPMYVSYSLFFVGLPLALLNVLLLVCIVGIPGYYMIAREEERILIKRFGEEYRNYQKRVGMFLPKVV